MASTPGRRLTSHPRAMHSDHSEPTSRFMAPVPIPHPMVLSATLPFLMQPESPPPPTPYPNMQSVANAFGAQATQRCGLLLFIGVWFHPASAVSSRIYWVSLPSQLEQHTKSGSATGWKRSDGCSRFPRLADVPSCGDQAEPAAAALRRL